MLRAPDQITRLNPVRLPSGAQADVTAECDLGFTLPVIMQRAYSQAFTAPSPLGLHHVSSLDLTITDGPEEGTYAVMTLDGIAVIFDRPPPQLFSRTHNDGFPNLSLEPLSRAGLKLNDRKLSYHFKRYPGRVWRIVEISDLNGNRVMLDRDAQGLLTALRHPDGVGLHFRNRPDGLRAGYDITGTDGSTLAGPSYDYDAAGRLVSVSHPFDADWRYDWDEANRRVAADNGAGTATRHIHDDAGRVVAVDTGGGAKHGQIDYAQDGRLITVNHGVDGTEFEKLWFDELGRQFMRSDAAGNFSYRQFNAQHALTAEIDPNGSVTALDFDRNGNLQSVTDAEGREIFTIWDDLGNPLSITHPDGTAETFEYDDRGLLTQYRDAAGHVTNYRYNDAGQMVQLMRHDGLITFHGYDAQNRLVSVIDTGSGETTLEYDAFNRVVALTDPLGGVTRMTYDAGTYQMPTRITRPDGVETVRTLSGAGYVDSVTDGENRVTRYRHGAYGLLEEITDPRGNTLRFAYDSRERLTCVTNQLGLEWRFHRDATGRVVEEVDFGGRALRYAYDPGGRLIRREAPDGSRLEYTYDRAGLLTELRLFDAGAETPEIMTYGYDANGALTSASNAAATITLARDARGLIVAETVNGVTVASEIDCCGQRVQRRIDGQVVNIAYDGNGAMTGWELDGHAPLTLTRDAMGQELSRSNGQGFALTQDWDAAGQLVQQTAGEAVARSYDWSRAFEPVTISDARHGVQRFTYDANGQITRQMHGDGGEERFAYLPDLTLTGSGDATGFDNWQTTTAGVVQLARGPDGASIALTHDACGRVIRRRVEQAGFRPQVWQFTWNALDQLVSATCPDGAVWTYTYDPFGRRIAKETKGLRHAFLWDGEVIARETVNGTAVDWFHAPGGYQPIARLAEGVLSYVVTDHLGTPKELLSEAGSLLWRSDHDTWGSLRITRAAAVAGDFWTDAATATGAKTADPATCPIRFAGQWHDVETGLSYNRFRYYDAAVGNYLSPDPIGLLGGTRPMAYVGNPAKYLDPLGLRNWSPMGSGICIVQAFPAGSAAANELAEFVGRWNNEIIARGGRMTAGPLTELQQRISDRWRREFRRNNCCGPNQVAGHVPDAAAGGLPNPSNGGMLQMAETNRYLAGITRGLSQERRSYTRVYLRDQC